MVSSTACRLKNIISTPENFCRFDIISNARTLVALVIASTTRGTDAWSCLMLPPTNAG